MTSRPARPGRPATRRLVINWPLVEQRRIAAGLTQAQLTDRIRDGALTGRGRLWTDADHDHVPLGLLERLCQVLDLHPAELFRPPARAAHRRALAPEQPPADATVLEAALATITVPAGTTGIPIGMATLADALGWSLDRLGTAVAALTGQLTGTGIRIDADPAPARPSAACAPVTVTSPATSASRYTSSAAPGRPLTPRRPKSSTSLPAIHAPSPSATGTSTQRSSSPCNSAGSSAVIPAATTSNSPMTPSSRWHPRCRIYPVPSTDIFVAASADISCRFQ